MRAVVYGLLASFFFACTFILNRAMDLEGGHWAWSASLRFFFMLPMLACLLGPRRLRAALLHFAAHRSAYVIWSCVGFGLFYAPLSFAAAYGEGWLVAGTWQITIICGPLLVPFLQQRGVPKARIPFSGMRWSLLILLGVGLMQWEHAAGMSAHPFALVPAVLLCVAPITLAAFMYPLGNRKMMRICGDEVDTFQRVFNMTLASLPFWILVALWGLAAQGLPGSGQVGQSALVALFSGVVATLLFFAATNLVRRNPERLAAVEATQSGEVIFALLGEILLLHAPLPSAVSLAGIVLVCLGMILHSLRSGQ